VGQFFLKKVLVVSLLGFRLLGNEYVRLFFGVFVLFVAQEFQIEKILSVVFRAFFINSVKLGIVSGGWPGGQLRGLTGLSSWVGIVG
jgi:hypothetical protein